MIEIQEMTAADVADIAALERLCFSAPWSENSIAEELETGFSLWLVARLDGAFAGYVGAQAYYEYLAGNIADQTLNAYATRSMEGEAL